MAEASAELSIERVIVGPIATCCYIVSLPGRDDCLVIDPGAEPERILEAVGERRIAAILLTHGHFDHIDGIDGLMRPDLELMVHEDDAALLTDPSLNASVLLGYPVAVPEATRLLKDGDTVTVAGITLQVLHTPGHTRGSVCYEAGKILFTGDTVFHAGFGRTDLPGGSAAALRTSLRRLSPLLQDHTIYPGHGG